MIDNANKNTTILATGRAHSETVLFYLQVTTHSTLGAIVLDWKTHGGAVCQDRKWTQIRQNSAIKEYVSSVT